ncbi:MAG: ABC transporter ATP-binding protein [Candidatus Omnitrophota bacterium]|nr:MAG: ABC transporter ATP-binding protein [Candidatus Omnitrophota bacterium]
MSSFLDIVSVTKTYHNGREGVLALDNVSLSLGEGDFLSVVGPSGAGKSTLLHIMGGLDSPTQGKVVFKGADIYGLKDKNLSTWRGETVGFVFQFYHLIEELNVLENITIAAFPRGKRKSSLKTARELLQYLGIEKRQHFFPSQLSGGERQKVALARALINDPQLLLCDEPTGNLDKDSQGIIIQLLKQLNKERKKTIVIVTHNLELAAVAKRIININGGIISA